MANRLRQLLKKEKTNYLDNREQQGGTAEGFRECMRAQYRRDPLRFNSLVLDALMESTTKCWQAQPRKHGKDLFSVAEVSIPEFLTRPIIPHISEEILDDDEAFEKVSQKFATVSDLDKDLSVKLRKAAQSAAAANELAKALDEARRRAHGDDSTFLRDVADAPVQPDEPEPDPKEPAEAELFE